MTRKGEGNFAKKHPPGTELDGKIAEAIWSRAQGGGINCLGAFEIARDFSVPLIEVGRTADLLEVPILKCQLGLFGYGSSKKIVEPAKIVEPGLEKLIRKKLVNGRLVCAVAFTIAERFKIPKLAVSSACEKLGVKISSCQLGAF